LVLVYEKEIINKLEQKAPLGKSDHNIIVVTLNEMVQIKDKKVMSYKYNKARYDIRKERIEKINWDELSKNGSTEDVWNK